MTGSKRGSAAVAGVDRAKILVDPGIGFGKTLQTISSLLNGLALFHGLGCPMMLGASRKRMIGALSERGARRTSGCGGLRSRWRSRARSSARR
jgi:dihydropteroate synthase